MCAGRGGKKGAVETCGTCKGSRIQVHLSPIGPGMVQQIRTACGDCQGQGEKISAKDRCKQCQGKKIIKNSKILEVHIDKGKSYALGLCVSVFNRKCFCFFKLPTPERNQTYYYNFVFYIHVIKICKIHKENKDSTIWNTPDCREGPFKTKDTWCTCSCTVVGLHCT